MRKNGLTFAVNSLLIFLLICGLTGCFTSAFSIETSPAPYFCIFIFTALFSLLCEFIKSKSKLFLSIGVVFCAYIFIVLFSLKSILSSANYVINCVLSEYSKYLNTPKSLSFSAESIWSGDVFICAASFLYCAVFAVFLLYLKRIWAVEAMSLLTLLPCFALITTLPKLVWLLPVVSILLALLLSRCIIKRNPQKSGGVLLFCTSAVLIFSLILTTFIPLENYQRSQWQTDLQNAAENLTGINHSKGGAKSKGVIDLKDVGPQKLSNDEVMRVRSSQSGALYLRGTAYANYNDNSWSQLYQSQKALYPEGFNSQTITRGEALKTLDIEADKNISTVYIPYFTSALPKRSSVMYDIGVECIENNVKSYSLSYYPLMNNGDYRLNTNDNSDEYISFVNNTYRSIDTELSQTLISLAYPERGEYDYYFPNSGFVSPERRREILAHIKDFVTNSAEYSLDTPQFPADEDFATYFLTQSDAGYCVHFATAATLLLRANGIPARYVTGYLVNARANEWVSVQEKHAHAWAEYFDEERGWIPLEATPSAYELEEETEPATEPTTAQLSSNATEPTTLPSTSPAPIKNPKSDDKIFTFALIAAIILLIAIIPLRRAIILKIRRKKLESGNTGSQAIFLYRNIVRINTYSARSIPEELEDIALKARFGNTEITEGEVSKLRKYLSQEEQNFLDSNKKFKIFVCKYFKVLF